MNYLIFLLGLILFISQEFVLFNEETLILICFICFYFVILNKFRILIFNTFKNQSFKIENMFITSLNEVIKFFLKVESWKFKLNILNVSFISLKNYYLKFNYNIVTKLIKYNSIKKNKVFNDKINYIFQLEQQVLKLIILIFKNKLNKIVFIIDFYENNICLKKFKCFKKISLREQLEDI